MSTQFQYKEVDTLKHLIKAWERYANDIDIKNRILTYLMTNNKPLMQDWLDHRRLKAMLIGDDGKGDEKLEMSTRMTIASRSATSASKGSREKTMAEIDAERDVKGMNDDGIQEILDNLGTAKGMPVAKKERKGKE